MTPQSSFAPSTQILLKKQQCLHLDLGFKHKSPTHTLTRLHGSTKNTDRSVHTFLPLSRWWSCSPLSPCCPQCCWWVYTEPPLQSAVGGEWQHTMSNDEWLHSWCILFTLHNAVALETLRLNCSLSFSATWSIKSRTWWTSDVWYTLQAVCMIPQYTGKYCICDFFGIKSPV